MITLLPLLLSVAAAPEAGKPEITAQTARSGGAVTPDQAKLTLDTVDLAIEVFPAREQISGVALDPRGFIQVDERLATTAPGIWALGEAAGSPMFTHVSLDDYRVAKSGIEGGIEGGGRITTGRMVPYCVFIEPEFARVGLSEREAEASALPYRLARLPMEAVPRARTLSERTGFMKALVGEDDRILGFAMLGAQAGEVMTAVQMAMMGGLSYTGLRDAILAHPTLAEGLNLLFATVPPRA